MAEDGLKYTQTEMDIALLKERQKAFDVQLSSVDGDRVRLAIDLNKKIDELSTLIKDQYKKMEEDKEQLKKEMQDDFVTRPEFEIFKEQITNKVANIVNKAMWTIGTLVGVGTVVSWVLMIYSGFIK